MDSIKFAQWGGKSPVVEWTAAGMVASSLISANAAKANRIQAPAARSYLGEMQDALNAQSGIQGQALGLEAQWTPAYQQLQKQTLMGQMGTLNDLYGTAGQYSQGLQNAYLGMQAPIYGQVGQAARNAYQQTLDPTTAGLYSTMSQQAATGLANGTALSDQENRLAQQSARAAMAARGMQQGNQAIAAEVLNSYNLGQARQAQNRAFAKDVYGIGQSNASQAMNMYGSPLMAQLNQVSPVALLGTAGTMSQGLGTHIFQPESQYNAGVHGANQSNTMQTQLGNAQAQAGWGSGLMSMVGSLGSAYLKNPNNINTQQPAPANGTWTYSAGSPVSVSANMGGQTVNLNPQGYVIP